MASTLIIYDRVIASFTLSSTGMVNRWMEVKMEQAERFAAFYAPKRSGRLAASMSHGLIQPSSTRTRWGLGSNLEYSVFVAGGTTGPITAGGKWMPVGKSQTLAGRPNKWQFKQSVRGQAANDFMWDALRTVFRRI